jgi:pimeloyl-ACP methyl ester carboxylesterase
VVQLPDTRYAVRGDGVNIAYQVLGEGPLDLVFCFGFISHLDLQWSNPHMTRFFTRLASFSRLVLYDKAGTGLSDPLPHVPTLEERAEDLRAVMDAAGVERAALFGESEGGPSAMLFAASYPERTSALILYGSVVKTRLTDEDRARADIPPDAWGPLVEGINEAIVHWGRGLTLPVFAPSADSAIARRAAGTYERAAVSPGMAQALIDALDDLDVTEVARTVSVPTLILHRRGETLPVGMSRLLAEVMQDAEFIELEGVDHAYFIDGDQIIDEVERFLTGTVRVAQPDRVLTTILFSDIVESTRRVAESATPPGEGCSSATTLWCARVSMQMEGEWLSRLVMGPSQRFQGPREPSTALSRSSARLPPLDLKCGWVSTRASARSSERTSGGSPCTSARASVA